LSARAGVVLTPLSPILADTTYASQNGNIPALIDFENQTSVAVDVYRIDYAADRILYNSLNAGQSYLQGTFLTKTSVADRHRRLSGYHRTADGNADRRVLSCNWESGHRRHGPDRDIRTGEPLSVILRA